MQRRLLYCISMAITLAFVLFLAYGRSCLPIGLLKHSPYFDDMLLVWKSHHSEGDQVLSRVELLRLEKSLVTVHRDHFVAWCKDAFAQNEPRKLRLQAVSMILNSKIKKSKLIRFIAVVVKNGNSDEQAMAIAFCAEKYRESKDACYAEVVLNNLKECSVAVEDEVIFGFPVKTDSEIRNLILTRYSKGNPPKWLVYIVEKMYTDTHLFWFEIGG